LLKDETVTKEAKCFNYRYAVFRQGIFYRWEQPSDIPTVDDEDAQEKDEDVDMQEGDPKHMLYLANLVNREAYVVNDTLGSSGTKHGVSHVREMAEPVFKTVEQLALTSKENSQVSMHRRGASAGKLPSNLSIPSMDKGKQPTHVGFEPTPPPFHPKGLPANRQAVHLNSTDGLVVVSAFLPVVMNRSESGEWSADWDYEMLLSMQTHLRVNRVGIVKWRGWHGNHGGMGSPEGGVPVEERGKVEECLLPFHCVPVWVEPKLFGEMYVVVRNGYFGFRGFKKYADNCLQVQWVLQRSFVAYSSQRYFSLCFSIGQNGRRL
jgi:hypothetical protein